MRWVKYLMCILCVVSILCPVIGRADLPAIIDQYDKTFYNGRYSYLGKYFWENGCGPSSMANVFISGLGVTDKNVAADILYDILEIMSYNRDRESVDVKRYPFLITRNSSVLRICKANNWELKAVEYQLNPSQMAPFLSEAPVVVMARQIGNDYWKAAIDYAQYLYDHGYPDAVLYLVRIGTGTMQVDGPLANGRAGHYVSFYMPVGEFIEQGSIYLLDSAPSALSGEIYGSKEVFKVQYPFVAAPNKHRVFLETYGVERIHQNIIRFYLLDPEADRLEAANLFVLYGTPFWTFFIK